MSNISVSTGLDLSGLATELLRQRQSTDRSAPDFAAALDSAHKAVSAAASPEDGSAHAVGVQFEAMFLRQVLEDMLPKNANNVFGSGTAGGIWRSMLAEHLANSLADRNILGLAGAVVASTNVERKSSAE